FPVAQDGQTESLPLQLVLARLYDPDRNRRAAAAAGLTRGLKDNSRLLTFILNNLVLEHRSPCSLRKHASAMAARHLANALSSEVVDALMTAAERYFPSVRRYYRLKGKLLGLEPLYDYDRYAPVLSEQTTVDWATAQRIVEESYGAFNDQAGQIIRDFFSNNWIDAEVRGNKRGGAFCSGTVPSVHPYVLM